jgi:hypothetical protein
MNTTIILQNEETYTHISMVLQRIYEMMAVPSLRDHAKSLLGPRTRGSTTTWGLEDVDQLVGKHKKSKVLSLMAFEVEMPEEVKMPGCRYFKFSESYLEGTLGARALSRVLKNDWCDHEVKVRKGAHGYELYIDRTPDEWSGHGVTTCEHYIILGPDETGTFPEVVYTWHPGRPLAPANKGLSDHTAVKEHNGN